MELADYSRFLFAFAFVIGLIWAVAALVKRFGLDQKMRGISGSKESRLQLLDVLYLDSRRKIALVRADAREYVVLLTPDDAVIVDKMEKKHEPVV
jgi:flagellar protein FliO/FliZ